MVCGAGCEKIHKESVENKVFTHSSRKERVMVWRDTPALRGGGFELLLDYNWIKKVEGGELLLCGPWAVGTCNTGCSLFQCFLPGAVGRG